MSDKVAIISDQEDNDISPIENTEPVEERRDILSSERSNYGSVSRCPGEGSKQGTKK